MMNKDRPISVLFFIAAAYDGVLGAIFLIGGSAVFRWFNVTPPNHPGYIQFPACLLIIFAIMFARIALAPRGNRNLIPYGILLKIAYCVTVGYYWITTGLPDMWKPFCIADLVFLVLFVWAWTALRKIPQSIES